jgi:hypothetical protein
VDSNARAGNRDFETGMGLMLRIQRTTAGYATAVLLPAGMFPCFSAIDSDPEVDRILGEALRSGAIAQANSLRREPRDLDASCLLHVEQYCFCKLSARTDGGSVALTGRPREPTQNKRFDLGRNRTRAAPARQRVR